jgi:hypothetical protein
MFLKKKDIFWLLRYKDISYDKIKYIRYLTNPLFWSECKISSRRTSSSWVSWFGGFGLCFFWDCAFSFEKDFIRELRPLSVREVRIKKEVQRLV